MTMFIALMSLLVGCAVGMLAGIRVESGLTQAYRQTRLSDMAAADDAIAGWKRCQQLAREALAVREADQRLIKTLATACHETLRVLSNITTEEFSQGGDSEARLMLIRAIEAYNKRKGA